MLKLLPILLALHHSVTISKAAITGPYKMASTTLQNVATLDSNSTARTKELIFIIPSLPTTRQSMTITPFHSLRMHMDSTTPPLTTRNCLKVW